MNRTQAGLLVGRLNAHFPSLAANDLAAQDWVDVVAALSYEAGTEVVNLLVTGWVKDRPPRVADWQETARQVAHRHRELDQTRDRVALEAGSPPQKERIGALIGQAKAALANPKKPTTDAVLPQRVSKYDREPVVWGKPGTTMTPEERAAELAAFGDRRVRERRLA